MKRLEQPKKKELTERELLEKMAALAWQRGGHPRAMLADMRPEELMTLGGLTGDDGKPVAEFRDKLKAFVDEYYESRKASGPEQDQDPQGFGLPTPPEETDPIPQQLTPATEE